MSDNLITVTLHTTLDRVIEAPSLAVGAHIQARDLVCYPGGKGANASAALDKLGVNNIATGFVGKGEFETYRNHLRDVRMLSLDQPTRTNITLVDPGANTDLHLRFSGYTVTPADIEALGAQLEELIHDGAVVAFCGSLPPGMSPTNLVSLIKRVRSCGAKIALDLSGEPLIEALNVGCWLAKPNEEELAEAVDAGAFRCEAEVFIAAMKLREHAEWVAVTLGSEGAILVGPSGAWRGRCDMVGDQVVNTVGCGDCFLGGLLAGFTRGQQPEQVLATALAAATANAAGFGVARFDCDQVASLVNNCHIEIIDTGL